MKAYLPIPDLNKRSGFYSPDLFQYDPEQGHYICPQNHVLPLRARRKGEEVVVYRADVAICSACPVKEKCTNSKSGRLIFVLFTRSMSTE